MYMLKSWNVYISKGEKQMAENWLLTFLLLPIDSPLWRIGTKKHFIPPMLCLLFSRFLHPALRRKGHHHYSYVRAFSADWKSYYISLVYSFPTCLDDYYLLSIFKLITLSSPSSSSADWWWVVFSYFTEVFLHVPTSTCTNLRARMPH